MPCTAGAARSTSPCIAIAARHASAAIPRCAWKVSSLIGWNRPGGYAEYVPVPENCLLPVPDDIEDSLAPLLLDVIGTSGMPCGFVSRIVPPDDAGPVLVTGARSRRARRRAGAQKLGYDTSASPIPTSRG